MNFENEVERLSQWWDAQTVRVRLMVLDDANMCGITRVWDSLPERQRAELWRLARAGRLPVFQV